MFDQVLPRFCRRPLFCTSRLVAFTQFCHFSHSFSLGRFFSFAKKEKKEEKMADGPFAKVRAYGRCAATRLATCKGHKGRVGEGCCTAGTEKEAGSLSGFKCTQYSWRPLAMCKEKEGTAGRGKRRAGKRHSLLSALVTVNLRARRATRVQSRSCAAWRDREPTFLAFSSLDKRPERRCVALLAGACAPLCQCRFRGWPCSLGRLGTEAVLENRMPLHYCGSH